MSDENVYLEKIVSISENISSVKELIVSFAPYDDTVLITGESGTGKELVANALHYLSGRSHKPFRKVNCAAVPENLIESELFGHEKGAFTGAVCRRSGKFESTDGGTIFLDEIADMNRSAQSKVLRIIQEKEFERIGSNRVIKVDVRIIAATNKDLEAEVRGGGFREDLFYRLKVFDINIPPLRERPDDIPVLVNYFLKKFSRNGNDGLVVDESTIEILEKYSWPGNVRELENEMKRAIALVDRGKVIRPKHIRKRILNFLAYPASITLDKWRPLIEDAEKDIRSFQKSLQDFRSIWGKEIEKIYIEAAFREVKDDSKGKMDLVKKASILLRCSVPTLMRRIKELDIDHGAFLRREQH